MNPKEPEWNCPACNHPIEFVKGLLRHKNKDDAEGCLCLCATNVVKLAKMIEEESRRIGGRFP